MKNPKNARYEFNNDGRSNKPKGFWKKYLRKWLAKKMKKAEEESRG